jgi:hypothetical protein
MYSDPIVIAAVTALVEAPEMEAAERKDVEGGGGGYDFTASFRSSVSVSETCFPHRPKGSVEEIETGKKTRVRGWGDRRPSETMKKIPK